MQLREALPDPLRPSKDLEHLAGFPPPDELLFMHDEEQDDKLVDLQLRGFCRAFLYGAAIGAVAGEAAAYLSGWPLEETTAYFAFIVGFHRYIRFADSFDRAYNAWHAERTAAYYPGESAQQRLTPPGS